MSARDFAMKMKAEIEEMKQQGIAAVFVDNLINYLSAVENSPEPEPTPAAMERYKAELNQHLETFRHRSAASLEMFKSVIEAGQNAVKTMLLINGGASVAILAFLGQLARLDGMAVRNYADCLLPFVVGTLLAGLVSGATYLSQWLYGAEKPWSEKWGMIVNILAIALGIASFFAFGIGSWWTYSAFTSIPIEIVPNTTV